MAQSLFSPVDIADPYPIYAELRRRNPVYRLDSGEWVVTRYQDVRACLRDGRLAHWASLDGSPDGFERVLARWVGLMDPRAGAHLGRLVAALLGDRAVSELTGSIRTCADLLLEKMERSASPDLVRDVSEPLALFVIGRLLGVTEAEDEEFAQLFGGTGQGLLHAFRDPAGSGFIFRLFEQQRNRGKTGLVGAILAAQTQGDAIGAGDYLPFAAIFMYAGHENMANFLSGAVLQLARHPDQWQRLRADPRLIDSGIEELLRFDSPIQFVKLYATGELEVAGRQFHSGDTLLVSIGSANRDEDVFENADTLDLARKPNPHLTFGSGALHCTGAAVARLEGRILLERLGQRYPRLPFAHDACSFREGAGLLRGLAGLPMNNRDAALERTV